MMSDYRALSFWFDSLPAAGTGDAGADDLLPRPSLDGPIEVDVAIVGGGLTGLWTAYYLASAQPSLRIAVLEKQIAGFGASGRNGGWCSALFPASTAALARRHGRDAAVAMREAMIETVQEVGRVTAAEGIDCDFVRGGTISLARGPAQWSAARAEVTEAGRWGVDDLALRDTAHSPRGAAGALGSTFDPACARLHPAKLVRGLARVVEQLGVTIYEETEVLSWRAREVLTEHAAVRA